MINFVILNIIPIELTFSMTILFLRTTKSLIAPTQRTDVQYIYNATLNITTLANTLSRLPLRIFSFYVETTTKFGSINPIHMHTQLRLMFSTLFYAF